ncbi:MAG: Isonitrile hydratase [Acidobacteria bacterium]|nr:Isonitrile hydratase [Acidobacteriota bacterium]
MENVGVRKVAILIFDEVEVLDFCGPFEVFAVTGRGPGQPHFEVFTVAEKSGPVIARNGLSVNPRYTISDCPQSDILVVPGGYGTRREMNNQPLIEWIKATDAKAELIMSVCTGSLLLAKAGLLEGSSATTHWAAMDLLRESAPNTEVRADKQFVDNGRVLSSAGISAGIDLSLHVVAKLLGDDVAEQTAQWMEYKHWKGSEYWLNE